MNLKLTWQICTFLALTLGSKSYSQDYPKIVRETPCLFEYRTWFFELKRSENFVAPDGFTNEQCEIAKAVHVKIQEEQRLERIAEEARQAEVARLADLQEKEIARRPGARIGMTAAQVLNKTNWGTPLRIHTTTTSHGKREQWVYGISSYLYFENGRLVAIQN